MLENYEGYLRIVTEPNGTVKVYDEMSIYHFGTKVLGIQGPHMYSMVNNGSVPKEYIVIRRDKNGEEQRYIKVTEAKAFFATREQVKDKKAVQRIEANPAMAAEAFIAMVEGSDKKLGKQLRKWWIAQNAPATETK